jgi:Predicted metal-binding integral membrane protein (DUF2182)
MADQGSTTTFATARTAPMAAALAATLGLATASWIVAVRQMHGMDMGVATRLGSFGFFIAVWVWMMAAMMLPGAAPAVARHAHASGRVRAVTLFVGSYLAVWTLVGVAVYALYRPHGSFAAGAVVTDGRVGPRCRERRPGGQQHGQEQQAAQPEDRTHRRAGGQPAADETVRGPCVYGVGRPGGQAQAHAEQCRPGDRMAGTGLGGFGQAQQHHADQAQAGACLPAGRQTAPVDDAFGQRRGRRADAGTPDICPEVLSPSGGTIVLTGNSFAAPM